MTFPVVSESQGANASTKPLTIPLPSYVPGDLLIVHVMSSGGSSGQGDWTFDSSTTKFTELWSYLQMGPGRSNCKYRIMAAGDTGTSISVAMSSNQTCLYFVFKVAAGTWHGSTAPEKATNSANSFNNAPNPPTVSPSWGTADNLFITFHGRDGSTGGTCTDVPSDYTGWADVATNNCRGRAAYRLLTASSADPGAFALDSNKNHNEATIVVRPATRAQGMVIA